MAHGVDPTKCQATGKFLPRIRETLDGWRKQDPATQKELPVEVDVPEYLVDLAYIKGATEKDKAVADLVMIAFYYLLRVGEYTAKGKGHQDWEESQTQTQPFRLKDIAFFSRHPSTDRLVRLSPNASDDEIMSASNATLKLGNQKNGWKDVCINHEHNLHETLCGVRAIGRRYCHIRRNSSNPNTPLFTYYEGGKGKRVNDQDIREAVKMAARQLDYEGTGVSVSVLYPFWLNISLNSYTSLYIRIRLPYMIMIMNILLIRMFA